ncbi:MAG: PKD domain-containing protein [Algibacter sp.]
MNKYLFNIKCIVLVTLVSLTSCVSDDLANIGDLADVTGPTPFYTVTDVTSSEFDCDDVELWAKYEFNFQGGSNLAVNGTQYTWTVSPSDGVTLVNKDLPILEQSIEAELATVIALEEAIAKLQFKIPCETDQDKIDVFESDIVNLQADLQAAEDGLTDEVLQNVSDLENQITALAAATLEDKELIFSFPSPGDYTVSLTVTDNLGKSATTEKAITVNQAVPTIAIPEIGEPGFDDGTLFDGSGDGRDSWRAPSSSAWGSVFQINTKSVLGTLPEGFQAAKFPADGTRVGYQEIDVTPGATYVLTYFSALAASGFGDISVGIISPNATTLEEAKLEANIIASRTDSNVGRVDDVFKKHAITFEAGENETVIILLTNSGVEGRLDAFEITVKQ